MEKKEYLSEEKFQKSKKKITIIALVVLMLGVLAGGSLIAMGLTKNYKVNNVYPKEIVKKEAELNTKKTELENQIQPTVDEINKLLRVPFEGFNEAYYERQDKVAQLKKTIAPVQKQINEINDYFDMGMCHNANITMEVCALKEYNTFDSIPLFMIGAFIVIASGMFAGTIFMIAKGRDILAFGTQQTMPVVQEGMEKMAPTIGKAAGTIAKEGIEQVAPTLGKALGTIAKDIKDSLNDEEK